MEGEFKEVGPEEEVEMKQLDRQTDDDSEWDISFDRDETSFIDETVSNRPNTDLTTRLVLKAVKRRLAHRDTEDFFTNVLELEPQCSQPEFVDYLLDTGSLVINRVFNKSSSTTDYRVRYLDEEFESILWVVNGDDNTLLRDGIREQYDRWTKETLNKTMKRAGVIAAVGLGVIALVTGLSVGLTRKGADMVHQAKKWEKLHPSKKTTTIPWTAMKAGGKTIIFAGEYYLVISAGAYY